jgi:hypothetical protein
MAEASPSYTRVFQPHVNTVAPHTKDIDELIPTRNITGSNMCIDYQRLNQATMRDNFSDPIKFKSCQTLRNSLNLCILRFLKCSCKFSKYENIVRNFLIYIFVKYGRSYLIPLFLSWLYIITKSSFLYTPSVSHKIYVH